MSHSNCNAMCAPSPHFSNCWMSRSSILSFFFVFLSLLLFLLVFLSSFFSFFLVYSAVSFHLLFPAPLLDSFTLMSSFSWFRFHVGNGRDASLRCLLFNSSTIYISLFYWRFTFFFSLIFCVRGFDPRKKIRDWYIGSWKENIRPDKEEIEPRAIYLI